ncbi:malonate decarboxylase holo-ACP synthase [Aquitalea sp.]|uniref:malonate decarboxylase holo-ACP synthase n=1 Tax=Aquitalea sp. TaxID=1872623 RepID=UPI00258E92EE|nr:malonate decarboxylase holo-ACP synthase [Aquitalea sp.]
MARLSPPATPQAHDLLWLTGDWPWLDNPALPEWLRDDWQPSRPVVVRRDQATGQRIPVGIRGRLRSQRQALWVELATICRSLSPEQLAARQDWQRHPRYRLLPPLQALQQLHPWLDDLEMDWGITGGVGYELASGWPALGPGSDLDLLLRTPHPPSMTALHQLVRRTQKLGCRVDIQLETPAGGIALQEWLRGGKVMVKTGSGPRLLHMPWNVESAQ